MRVAVFDFDGVIIPSEGIKADGYSLMFSERGEAVPRDAIEASRAEFAGAKGDRYDIIRGIFTRIGETGEQLEAHVREYAERFTKLVQLKIDAFEVDPSVRKMLERLSSHGPVYINSNTPDGPLRESLDRLGILGYFKGVYGSSTSKVKALQDIAADEQVQASEIVFIGDGEGDRDAAREFGCEFVGVATSINGWKDGAEDFPVLTSVSEFDTKYDGHF